MNAHEPKFCSKDGSELKTYFEYKYNPYTGEKLPIQFLYCAAKDADLMGHDRWKKTTRWLSVQDNVGVVEWVLA